jgi:hypothetical protein
LETGYPGQNVYAIFIGVVFEIGFGLAAVALCISLEVRFWQEFGNFMGSKSSGMEDFYLALRPLLGCALVTSGILCTKIDIRLQLHGHDIWHTNREKVTAACALNYYSFQPFFMFNLSVRGALLFLSFSCINMLIFLELAFTIARGN